MSLYPNEEPSTQPIRRRALIFIVAILVIGATLRIVHLNTVPQGFSPDESATIQVSETIRRLGAIASFYSVADSSGSHEGLYSTLQAVGTNVLGDGLLCFRLLPMWLGLLSLALAYALVRRLFGSFAGLVAALTLATTFYPVLLSRSATRESLLLALLLAFLFLLAQAVHLRRDVKPAALITLPFIFVGVLLALLAYTQWTGLVAVAILIAVIVYLFLTHQPISRRVISLTAFGLLVALILCIPYLTFTLRAPSLSGLYVYWANRPVSVGAFLDSLLQTLAGLVYRGDVSAQHNLPGNPLFGPLGALLLLIGLIAALRHWRSPNVAFSLITLLIGLFPAIWSRTDMSASGSVNFADLVVALPALIALIGLGAHSLLEWYTKRVANVELTSAIVMLTIAGAISAGVVAVMMFWLWQADPQVDSLYQEQLGRVVAYVDHVDDGRITDICSFNLDNGQKKIADPALIDLMNHRPLNNLRLSDCLMGFVLANGGASQRVAYAEPGQESRISGAFNPWLSNANPVTDPALTPGSVVWIDVQNQLADAIGKLTQSQVTWSLGTTGPSPSPDVDLPVRMGGYLTFEGYAYDRKEAYKPGDMLTVVTYWRADGDQIPDLRIFVHVLPDPNAAPVAQNDILSVDPTLLRARDIFIQMISVPLPADMSQGDYYVSVGAYGAGTKDRLPVYDHEEVRSDRLFLDMIKVQP